MIEACSGQVTRRNAQEWLALFKHCNAVSWPEQASLRARRYHRQFV
ncbi:MAG: hypothetical protein P8179_12020 [Candidatus Thiodiazotropha sp.]